MSSELYGSATFFPPPTSNEALLIIYFFLIFYESENFREECENITVHTGAYTGMRTHAWKVRAREARALSV